MGTTLMTGITIMKARVTKTAALAKPRKTPRRESIN
jgi:hypothetical protein